MWDGKGKCEMKKNSFLRAVLIVTVLVLLIVIIVLRIRLSRLKSLREQEQNALRERQRVIDSIEYDLTMPRDEFIEKDARERGYRQNGEIVFENGR